MNSPETVETLPSVVLKFSGLDYYPSELIIGGLELVEAALHDLEEGAITQALEQNGGEEFIYAVRAELDKVRRRHLQIYTARDGCIEHWAIMGATSFWVLQLTIGESMKEAYKKSPIHQQLSAFFSRDVRELADDLSSHLTKNLRSAKRNTAFVVALSRVRLSVHVHHREPRAIMVSLVATREYESIPPSILRPRRG